MIKVLDAVSAAANKEPVVPEFQIGCRETLKALMHWERCVTKTKVRRSFSTSVAPVMPLSENSCAKVFHFGVQGSSRGLHRGLRFPEHSVQTQVVKWQDICFELCAWTLSYFFINHHRHLLFVRKMNFKKPKALPDRLIKISLIVTINHGTAVNEHCWTCLLFLKTCVKKSLIFFFDDKTEYVFFLSRMMSPSSWEWPMVFWAWNTEKVLRSRRKTWANRGAGHHIVFLWRERTTSLNKYVYVK